MNRWDKQRGRRGKHSNCFKRKKNITSMWDHFSLKTFKTLLIFQQLIPLSERSHFIYSDSSDYSKIRWHVQKFHCDFRQLQDASLFVCEITTYIFFQQQTESECLVCFFNKNMFLWCWFFLLWTDYKNLSVILLS